jgi:hypothetical protein
MLSRKGRNPEGLPEFAGDSGSGSLVAGHLEGRQKEVWHSCTFVVVETNSPLHY